MNNQPLTHFHEPPKGMASATFVRRPNISRQDAPMLVPTPRLSSISDRCIIPERASSRIAGMARHSRTCGSASAHFSVKWTPKTGQRVKLELGIRRTHMHGGMKWPAQEAVRVGVQGAGRVGGDQGARDDRGRGDLPQAARPCRRSGNGPHAVLRLPHVRTEASRTGTPHAVRGVSGEPRELTVHSPKESAHGVQV